jgi:hypothetical protein
MGPWVRGNPWILSQPKDVEKFSIMYFNTFNYLYPFLDRECFFSQTLPKAMEALAQSKDETTITLLVLALGQLAHEGALGVLVTTTSNRPSGVRGGSANLPPGFSLFSKAEMRIAFTALPWKVCRYLPSGVRRPP